MAVVEPGDYLDEQTVLERWPMLSRSELRRARKAKPPAIAHYAFPSRAGGPCYTAQQVQDYIDRTYLKASVPGPSVASIPCPASKSDPASPAPTPSASRSETTTSTSRTPTAAESGMLAGMTPALAASVGEALARQIKQRPRSRSRPSSPPRRKAPHKGRLVLVKS